MQGPDPSIPSTRALAMFPEPMKPMLYPTPAFVTGSVRRLLEDGGVPPSLASTVCGADARRGDGLGAAMLEEVEACGVEVVAAVVGVCLAEDVFGGAAGDDILFLPCLVTSA